jgi:hypothetical protein
MITIHLFWFHAWNVIAYIGTSEPIILGHRYTRSRKSAEGLLSAQLRKAKRLFPERNVLPGRECFYVSKGFEPKNMSEDRCPKHGDLSDFLPVTSIEG